MERGSRNGLSVSGKRDFEATCSDAPLAKRAGLGEPILRLECLSNCLDRLPANRWSESAEPERA